ncbi:6-O-methylguanine DNA methyltransferase, DNA binding domain protein [Mobiluncus mulieris FB024-16]|uniref:methylated-DNA--[protein]-cysteine S-methyltransferase n=1 Tax=Mobiluncus mulieris TaxID=2052 RepID=UPI0001E51BAA|nr:methylated-DNA--[protein]-cysteine S-methyltransferase [Mobiluncus mulieris]EFN92366.1 6-O-methylguanine DNA methyltransferase, DNA binding domain protein [Mobiluncus mulieris FB024-16]
MGFICWLGTGVTDIDCFYLRIEVAAGLITRIDFRRTMPPGSSGDVPLPEAKSLPIASLPATTTPPAHAPSMNTPTAKFPSNNADSVGQTVSQDSLPAQVEDALARWRAGDPEAFRSLPLARAKTEFAGLVRQALLATHPGELITYQELARRARRPKAVRAAASACARNPLPLVVPCHRVIPTRSQSPGKTRDYGNYSYGHTLKAALIEYERQQLARR